MKKVIVFVFIWICVLAMVGCDTKSMNYIIQNKPSVTGFVEEVHDDYIIVYSEKADGYPYGLYWSLPLKVENQDSYTDIVTGDEIVFYYDGMAMETSPLQVSKVYAITLKNPADRTINERIGETNIEFFPIIIKNIFTGEETSLTVNEGTKTITNLLSSDLWNTEGTTDCLGNIEIIINGEIYKYHSDCGTFNDSTKQRYLSLDDASKEKVNAIIGEHISLASTEDSAE